METFLVAEVLNSWPFMHKSELKMGLGFAFSPPESMFSGKVHRKAGGSCPLTGCLTENLHLACCALEVCSFRLEIPPQLSNTGSDELGDLISTKSAGRSKKHMVCGFYKMYLLHFQTFKHTLNSKHLSPVGVGMVAHALSVCRTGIPVVRLHLFFFFLLLQNI